MQNYLKFMCGLIFIGLLGISCQKEAPIIPDQPVSSALTSGKGGPPPSSTLKSPSSLTKLNEITTVGASKKGGDIQRNNRRGSDLYKPLQSKGSTSHDSSTLTSRFQRPRSGSNSSSEDIFIFVYQPTGSSNNSNTGQSQRPN